MVGLRSNALPCSVFILLVGVCIAGGATSVRLGVTQDVTLERSYRNFDYLEYLIIAKHPGYDLKRSLLQFQDPPSVSSCAVNSATLYVYYSYAHKASSMSDEEVPYLDYNILLRRVNKKWNETVATSTIRESGSEWSERYLSTDGKDAGTAIIDSLFHPSGTPGGAWKTFDVTSIVKQWQDGVPNYGLLMMVEDEVTEGRDLRFFSNAYRDTSKHAYVAITCGEAIGCRDNPDGGCIGECGSFCSCLNYNPVLLDVDETSYTIDVPYNFRMPCHCTSGVQPPCGRCGCDPDEILW